MHMSLLREIQQSVIDDKQSLAPILLKLRLLAARLGSAPLEEWVKHESDGYPAEAEVPSYRKVNVSFRGTFSGPFGSGVNNAPISPYLVKKFAGKHWVEKEVREGVAAIDDLLESTADGDGSLGIDASDLILLLQGNVYPDYACNSVTGTISRSAMRDLQHAVRTRVLELTIELERSVPEASDVTLGAGASQAATNSEAVTQIANQIVYGDVTSISGGVGAQINVAIGKQDDAAFIRYLAKAGIAEADAKELAAIVATEEPESADQPFGSKAKEWFTKNIGKALDGTWKVTVDVATKVLTQAVLKYYDLK